jgi:hypothetical protein
MRVLVVTPLLRSPLVERTQYHPRALASILALRWTGQLDYYLPRGGDTSARGDVNVTRKYSDARCVALEGDYDAMLCAESDMIAPDDGLEKLAALDADIAYGLYCFRHQAHDWSAATELTRDHYRSLSADPESARAAWGQTLDVKGIGLGFTLIRRRVFERLPFRNWRGVSNDWALGVDAQAAGFRQVCDTSVVCGHFHLAERVTFWPDPDAPGLVRTEVAHAP